MPLTEARRKLKEVADERGQSPPVPGGPPPALASLLDLQRSAGNHAVARLLQSRSGVLARLVTGDLDFRTLAQRIHDAIEGLGTNEEMVYAALQQLERDPAAIATLKTTYKALFGEELLDAITGDFSGSELEYALQLLGGGSAGSAQAVGGTPSTPAEFDAAAVRIHNAVDGPGTDEEAIFAVLRPLNRDPKLIDQLKTAYKTQFNQDLVERLVLELSEEELAYALHLMRLAPSPGMEAVTQEMEGEVGHEATWTGSGPGRGNTFEKWASAPTEEAAPAIDPATSINCWEMILLCAYRAKLLSWQWIHDQYVAGVPDWRDHMYRALTRGARVPWKAGEPGLRGEIVFFDDIAHVSLATGTLDSAGRTEILSFWPPPNTPFVAGGTLDKVKITTIEELREFWARERPPGFAKIEFAAPPWS